METINSHLYAVVQICLYDQIHNFGQLLNLFENQMFDIKIPLLSITTDAELIFSFQKKGN